MRMLLLAAPAALACHGAPPRPDCQCLCAPTDTRPAGLIYLCQKRRWFCPRPATSLPAHQPLKLKSAPHR